MRVVDIKGGKGPISSLYINSEAPKPVPKGSQALIKIKAFGLNRMDLLQREGQYPLPPQAGPILGVEFSGTIDSFGADPERGFNVGDEVFGLAYGGAYAEYIAVSTHVSYLSSKTWTFNPQGIRLQAFHAAVILFVS